jgi:hypothetical protein
VVGKKAAAPEGSVVRFTVAGEGGDARSFTLAITGGRAGPAVAEAVPTVTLAMGSLNFLRLGSGRVNAALVRGAGEVLVEGDEDLGQRILENMNFMF